MARLQVKDREVSGHAPVVVRRQRLSALLVLLGLAALAGAGTLATSAYAPLSAAGPTSVDGTIGTSAFRFAGTDVRTVRYVDRRMLTYGVRLRNAGPVGVTVTGVEPVHEGTRALVRLDRVGDRADGRSHTFAVPAGSSRQVYLSGLMRDCERISIRGSTLVTEVRLHVRVMGLVPRTMVVALPEQLRVGSPRDEECPLSSPYTRPIG